MSREKFDMPNDYTLRVSLIEEEHNNDGVRKFNSYSRIFNFLARQVTVIHRDWTAEGRSSDAAGTSSVSAHVETQSFDDLPSSAEVEFMHKELVDRGGNPPSLDEILPGNPRKPKNWPGLTSNH